MPLEPTPFGKKTTAEEVLRGRTLAGWNAVVTGASSGLGTETARVLASGGAHVILACRSRDAGQQAAAAMPGSVEVEPLDLSDLASVRSFASRMLERGKPLHLLINNAGVMATPLGFTAQGFEQQLGTNHLGHFLLTTLLLEALAPGARIVNLSSGLHSRGKAESLLATLDGDPRFEKRKYVPFDAYGDSKLANILFTKALAERLPSTASTFALHPGVIATNLTRSLVKRFPVVGPLYRVAGRLFLKSIPQGAATTVFAATAPELDGLTGLYLSDCNEAPSSRASRDEALRAQVWSLSERAVAQADSTATQ